MREYVYETLMARSYDEPFSLYGLIAESVETPEDRSSVTFQIRPEARFADGTPVTPDDVLFSWSLLKSKGRPNHRSYYAKVATAEKIGERGVKFTFAGGGDREMPLIMGLMPVLPRHALKAEDFDKTSFEKPLASGPYVVAEVSPGASIVLKRNPDYWARNLPIMRGQFNFDTIRIDYYRDSTTMMEAFRKGLFDVMGDSDSIDAVKWADAFDFPAVRDGLVKKMEFSVGVPAPMAALAFNTRRAIFADPRVREALTRMFDFEWLNKQLFRGLYARTESFFDRSELSSHGRPADERERELLAPYAGELAPGAMDGTFSQPVTDGTGTNREGRKEAIALLNEAGYELKDGVMTAKATGLPFTFEMLCATREQQRLMLAYAAALRQIGIDAQGPHGRFRAVSEAEHILRLRHDADVLGLIAVSRQRAELPLVGRIGGRGRELQLCGRKSCRRGRHDRRDAQRQYARRVRFSRPRARPASAVGPLRHSALLRAQAMDRGVVASAPAAGIDALRRPARNMVGRRCEKRRGAPSRLIVQFADMSLGIEFEAKLIHEIELGFEEVDMLFLVMHELFEEIAAHIIFDGVAMGRRLLVKRPRLKLKRQDRIREPPSPSARYARGRAPACLESLRER